MNPELQQADWLTDSFFRSGSFYSLHAGPPEPISLPLEKTVQTKSPKDRLADFFDEPAWSARVTSWGRTHSLHYVQIEEDEE
ncbi:MAG: hypothetical protein WCP41_03065 [Verrucomicrobiota bacterium]